jgi:hypothetical protein
MATIHATDAFTTVAELERLFGGPPLHPMIANYRKIGT